MMWFVSRKIEMPENEKKNKLLIPFERMAIWCYGRGSKTQRFELLSGSVLRDLQRLYPGATQEQMREAYFAQKLSMALAIVFVGSVLSGIVYWQAVQEKQLQYGNLVYRGDYKAADKILDLEARVEGRESVRMTMEVHGQVPDKTEVDTLEDQFWQALCENALGNNVSFEQVSEDLLLVQTLPGYPFEAKWSSNTPYVLGDDGMIIGLEERETREVILEAVVTYDQWEWRHELKVAVVAKLLSQQEIFAKELAEHLVELEEADRTGDSVQLPEEWQGEPISWNERRARQEIVLWGLAVAAALGVFVLKDKDLHADMKKREGRLRGQYPVVVNKLLLYMGAGLTVRGAFYKIAGDYEQENAKNRHFPAYEEVLHTCRELDAGISEVVAYENMGKRCGVQEYIRLAALLSQNLKKGNSALLARLREEMEESLEGQLNQCKRAGEEASTKLLVPMMMMLSIVMVMIMIPAFGSF